MGTLLAAAAALAICSGPPASYDEGRRVYRTNCRTCHGPLGNAQGPTAGLLPTPPRDLSVGEFRWRSTPSGSLPLDSDLVRTVRDGLRGTWMVGWKDRMTGREIRSVVMLLKTFSDRFIEEEPDPAIPVPAAPPATAESLRRGKKAYELLKCGKCHGETGRGDGEAAPTLKDNAGRPIDAYDFTKGFYKRGSSPADIFRTYMAGLDGTPMPSYLDTIPEADRWPLVHYTRALGTRADAATWLFGTLEETR